MNLSILENYIDAKEIALDTEKVIVMTKKEKNSMKDKRTDREKRIWINLDYVIRNRNDISIKDIVITKFWIGIAGKRHSLQETGDCFRISRKEVIMIVNHVLNQYRLVLNLK